MPYFDLSTIPTTQLGSLTAASGVPPQEVNAEMLRRTQTQNAQGYSGGLTGLAQPRALVPATSGASYAQEDFGYPSFSLAKPGAVMGGPQPMNPQAPQTPSQDTHILQWLADKMKPNSPPLNVVPTDALASDDTGAAQPTDTSGMDIAALLRSIPSNPKVDINPVSIDWNRYKDQVKQELPDNLAGVADALNDQKGKADRQGKNALSQGLLAAGLSMLASRGSFFNALGNAGKEGLGQFNQQKAASAAQQQALLGDQLRMEQTRQANNQAVVQGTTQRATEDARVQQMNDQLRIQAALAQQNPAMLRAQIGLMALGQHKNPMQDSADKDFATVMTGVEKAMANPLSMQGQDPMQWYQTMMNYATQRRNAIMRGIDPNRIPYPGNQTPAGVRAQ